MELMNNPFVKIEGGKWVLYDPAEKLATIFFTLWKYLQLLVVPHPLTHDYYPRQIGLMTFSNPLSLLSLGLYGWMVWYALRGIGRRNPIAFGIWLYLLPLSIVSNLVFPIGTNMGERFAFMPSLGFCVVAAILLVNLFTKNKNIALAISGLAVVLFSVKTITRNPVWASNEKLFFTDAKTSINSAKLQNACGGALFDKARMQTDPEKQKEFCREAIPYSTQAIKIHPNYRDAFIIRGGCNFILGNFDAAIFDYREAVRLAPEKLDLKASLALALRDGGKFQGERQGNLAKAATYLAESWQYNSKDAETARLLGVSNGMMGKNTDAIMWFSKAVDLSPENATYLWDLGLAYYAAGNSAKGEELRQKAIKLDPNILETRGKGQ
jgi:hypothetical protein